MRANTIFIFFLMISVSLFLLSTGEATVLEFDELRIGTYVDDEYADLGVRFDPGGVVYLFDAGTVLGLDTGEIRAQFDVDVYEVGTNYNSNSYLWLEAYRSDGSLIDSVKASSLEGYFSISSNEVIAEVSIHDSGYSFTIDNFRFSNNVSAVPEESSSLLLGISILSLSFIKRKRIDAFR